MQRLVIFGSMQPLVVALRELDNFGQLPEMVSFLVTETQHLNSKLLLSWGHDVAWFLT